MVPINSDSSSGGVGMCRLTPSDKPVSGSRFSKGSLGAGGVDAVPSGPCGGVPLDGPMLAGAGVVSVERGSTKVNTTRNARAAATHAA